MTLAAVDFSYPFMLLVALLAAGVPVLLHLLNRVRSPVVPFPTLRFLRITAQKTSRRRQLQQWVLLVLRMALFAFLGLAVAGPVIAGGSAALAYGVVLLALAGVGLAALAAVMGATAVEKGKGPRAPAEDPMARSPGSAGQTRAGRGRAERRHGPAAYWGAAAVAGALALAAGGVAAYAFGSDRFFSRRAAGGFSGAATACAIVLDNSHSMLARQGGLTRLRRAADDVRQILLETVRPTEATLVLTNPGGDDAAVMTAEPSKLLARLETAEPLGRALPMRDRVEKALGLLKSSGQANKLLVVISDFQQEAFADVETFAKAGDVPGLQVALMPPAGAATPDLGVTRFELESGQPAVGTEVIFSAEVINNGESPEVAEVEFLVDGKPVVTARETVAPGRDGKLSRRVPYRLAAAGEHRFGLRVKDENGALDWDDTRELVLNVKDQIGVLVIGPAGQDRPRYRSAAYYAMAALAPFEGVKSVGGPVWSLAPVYKPVSAVDARGLGRFAAVFLCDVPQVPADLAAALKTYANAGGRVIVQAGPGVDVGNFNAVMLEKTKLVPARLTGPVVSAEGSRVDYVDVSPATAVFADLYDSLEPFQRVVVTGRWGVDGETGTVMWKLADGSPLIVRYPQGAGEVYLMLTVPSAAWSNLATQPAFLAAMNRMAQGDLGNARKSKSVETGWARRIEVPSENGRLRVFLTSPDKKTVEVAPSLGTPPTWMSPPILRAGVWAWETNDGPPPSFRGSFVANPPADEADLTKADEEAVAATIKTAERPVIAHTPAELAKGLRREERSLMPGILALVMMMLVAEAMMANRHRPGVSAVGSGKDGRRTGPKTAAETTEGVLSGV